MTTVQTIESQDMNLGKCLATSIVPNYQREYVWEDAELEQFFSDIYLEFLEVLTNKKYLYEGYGWKEHCY